MFFVVLTNISIYPQTPSVIGIDACYHNKFSWQMSDPLVSSTFYHIGIGPVIGYLYNLSKRLSFQTEVGLYYGHGENKYYNDEVLTYCDKGGFYTGHRFFSLNLFYQFK